MFLRNVSVLMMISACCRSSFAFVTNKANFSCLTTSPRIMILSSTIDENNAAAANAASSITNAGTSDNPFAMVDFERATECAIDGNSAECSFEEMVELRDSMNEQKLHDSVMTGIIGASPLMRERLEQESYLSARLTKKLVELNIEMLTKTTMPKSPEAAAQDSTGTTIVTPPKGKEVEATTTTKETVPYDTTPVAIEPQFQPLNQNLLESMGIVVCLGFMIHNDIINDMLN